MKAESGTTETLKLRTIKRRINEIWKAENGNAVFQHFIVSAACISVFSFPNFRFSVFSLSALISAYPPDEPSVRRIAEADEELCLINRPTFRGTTEAQSRSANHRQANVAFWHFSCRKFPRSFTCSHNERVY